MSMGFRSLYLATLALSAVAVQAEQKEVEIVDAVASSVTISGATDYHITSADAAIAAGATVNITSEDAGLFFDNVSPKTVLSKYADAIKIGGEPFAADENGRISVYRHGTLVMAHDKNFTPFVAYTGENLTGEQLKCAVRYYYSSAPASEVKAELRKELTLDNKIKSFTLKRGYMATLATEADGLGYSRVFVADSQDLTVDVLQKELNGKVSFIRVFKWEQPSKKGWVGGNSTVDPPEGYLDEQADRTRSTWVYSWGPNADWCVSPDAKGKPWRNQEFVPEKWGDGGTEDWNRLFNDADLTNFLSYNEPDHSEQSSVSVADAIAEWPKHLQTGMRLGSPATTEGLKGNGWLYQFLDECKKRNYRVDYVAIHSYWGGTGSSINCATIDDWYKNLKYIHERTGLPIWITEWNNGANWTHEGWPSDKAGQQEKQRKFIEDITAMMDTCKFIERYSLYNWVEEKRALFWKSKDLTPAGKQYANFDAALAYSPEVQVAPVWKVQDAPALAYAYDGVKGVVRLTWTDVNAEILDGWRLERSLDGGEFETVATLSYPNASYEDDVEAGHSVAYRLVQLLDNADKLTSNEVQYGSIVVNDSAVSIGKATVGAGQLFYAFDKELTETPNVVLGVQSWKMRSPMTTMITGMSSNGCSFGSSLWNYNENNTFVSRDTLAYAIAPFGIADNDKFQFGRVDNVGMNKLEVKFAKPFAEVPVVVASVVELFGEKATARVTDITKDGFSVCIQGETALTTALTEASVCWMAALPGLHEATEAMPRAEVGLIDNVTGTTSSKASKAEYAQPFVNPALFCALQTMNDQDAAMVPRAVNCTQVSFSVFKNVETSGGTANAKSAETVGYIVFESGKVAGVAESVADDAAFSAVYDSSVQAVRKSDGSVIRSGEVYALSGQLVASAANVSEVSVARLPKGVYIVRIDGKHTCKFVKTK